jgi:ABC-type branched-subunit amino acid transport system substrate-binding protein
MSRPVRLISIKDMAGAAYLIIAGKKGSNINMSRKLTRRKFVATTTAGVALATLKLPMPAVAQPAPFKLGLLTVKTGPLAQGGIQMEQGVVTFLKEKNYTFADRKVDFITTDTGGTPAGAKTKVQELIERDKVDTILGPLAAFELLAITDYIRDQKIPLLSLAAADDITQRRPNLYFLRPASCSSQAMHPMADFAAKELNLKRMVTISEDFAYGYEQMGGFQQTFEDNGGRIVNKIWPPIVTPDYTPYLVKIDDCDGVCQGFAGSNPLRFMKQYVGAGLKYPVVPAKAAVTTPCCAASATKRSGCIAALRIRSTSIRMRTNASSPRCRSPTVWIPGNMPPVSTSLPPWLRLHWKNQTATWATRKPSSKRCGRSNSRTLRAARCGLTTSAT